MVASPDGTVAMTTPPTLTDLAADPGELIASCQRCHHDAVLPVAPVLARYGPDTVPQSDRQVPLFGVRLPAGRCSAELVAALARPDHPPHLMAHRVEGNPASFASEVSGIRACEDRIGARPWPITSPSAGCDHCGKPHARDDGARFRVATQALVEIASQLC
jgi:hypothetical protein